MTGRITRVQLKRFRGATQETEIPFDGEQTVIMIMGENGSGKSTLIDAIDFVCNRKPGSIANRSSTRPAEHLPALGAERDALEVTLETRGGSVWKATLTARGEADVTHTAGDPVVPTVSILRRAELLKFVDARPADRYAAISPFIDVDAVERSEDALRKAVREQENRLDRATRVQNEAEEALAVLHENERLDHEPTGLLEWAEHRIAANVAELQNERQRLHGLILTIGPAEEAVAAWRARDADRANDEARLQQALENVETATARAAEREPDLLPLLQAAETYLAQRDDPEACPLCTQPVDGGQLRARIRAYLKSQRELTAATQQLRNTEREIQGTGRMIAAARDALIRTATLLLRAVVGAEIRALDGLDYDFAQELNRIEESDLVDLTHVSQLVGLILEQRQELEDRREAVAEQLAVLDNIRGLHDRLVENSAQAEEAQRLFDRLQTAHEMASATRRRFVETVLDSIVDEVNRLYNDIHPGEGSGLERLYLEENRRGSLHQKGRIQGVGDIVPQAYFSESHLDTLGFCIWLALAKQRGAQNAVLVLDDVFTSVDGPHLRRVAEVLEAEAPNFQQLIVATHSRHWYQLHQAAGRSAHLLHLAGWTLRDGIRYAEDRTLLRKLGDALDEIPLPRQSVASQAGILLEMVLDEVAVLYGCSLKRKRDEGYTLGELLSTTRNTLRVAEIHRPIPNDDGSIHDTSAWERVAIRPLVEAVDALTFIRNQVGAHFNLDGLNLADGDVRAFGQAVYDLADSLFCRRCGKVPHKNKTAHWGCSCLKHKTELTPLEKR